jgi:hypothetical protein
MQVVIRNMLARINASLFSSDNIGAISVAKIVAMPNAQPATATTSPTTFKILSTITPSLFHQVVLLRRTGFRVA